MCEVLAIEGRAPIIDSANGTLCIRAPLLLLLLQSKRTREKRFLLFFARCVRALYIRDGVRRLMRVRERKKMLLYKYTCGGERLSILGGLVSERGAAAFFFYIGALTAARRVSLAQSYV